MSNVLRALAGFALVSILLLVAPSTGTTTPVASSDATYQSCGRVFPDPHAYWPSPTQTVARSPYAKGNALCASVDFLTYSEVTNGMNYLETLFPGFVEFYSLEKDFGDGSDCATSTDIQDLCSAGLPRQELSPGRVKSDLYMIRVTDERVADTNKPF